MRTRSSARTALFEDGCARHGRMRIIAAVQSPDAIRRILQHVGLPADPQALSPARDAPSSGLLDFGLG